MKTYSYRASSKTGTATTVTAKNVKVSNPESLMTFIALAASADAIYSKPFQTMQSTFGEAKSPAIRQG